MATLLYGMSKIDCERIHADPAFIKCVFEQATQLC